MPQPTLNVAGFRLSAGPECLEIDHCHGIAVISLKGRLDSITATTVLDCVQWLLNGGETQFIVDCQQLDFISSAGLAELVKSNGQLKQQGATLAIAGATGLVAQTLRITRLDRLFSIYPDIKSASDAINQSCK